MYHYSLFVSFTNMSKRIFKQSVSQSVGRSVGRSVSQSVRRSVSQLVGQSVGQSDSHWSVSRFRSFSQSVSQSVSQLFCWLVSWLVVFSRLLRYLYHCAEIDIKQYSWSSFIYLQGAVPVYSTLYPQFVFRRYLERTALWLME